MRPRPRLVVLIVLLSVTSLLASTGAADVRGGGTPSYVLAHSFSGPAWQAVRFSTTARNFHFAMWYKHPGRSSAYAFFLYNASGERIDSGVDSYEPGHDGAYVESHIGGSPHTVASWNAVADPSPFVGSLANGTFDGSGTYTLVVWAAGSGVVPWNYTLTMDQPITSINTAEGNATGYFGSTDFHGGTNAMIEYGNMGARYEQDTRLDVNVTGILMAIADPGVSGHDNLTMASPNGTRRSCFCDEYAIAGRRRAGPGEYEFRLSGWAAGNMDLQEIVVMYADITLPS